jgi:drug/metabolite transporter (DMT)-like permease
MSYLPVLLGLSTAFCWGTSDYLSRRQSESVGHYRTTIYMHVTTLATLAPLIILLRPQGSIPLYAAALLSAAGALNFFAFIFLYRAFHTGVVSVVAPIAYTYPAVTTVLAFLLLGTVLTPMRTVALTSVMLGVILLSTRYSELKRYLRGRSMLQLTPGIGSAGLAALSFGTIYTGVGYVTPAVGFVVPVLFLRGVGLLAGILFAPFARQSVRPDRASLSATMIIMGILEALGFLAFNLGVSLSSDALPIAIALSGMGGAFATSYAIAFLRERLEPNQLLGVALSLAGVFALLYFGA